MLLKVPSSQPSMQSATDVEPLPRVKPDAHGVQSATPPGEKLPDAHSTQVMALPCPRVSKPGGQAGHDVEAGDDVALPGGHGRQEADKLKGE